MPPFQYLYPIRIISWVRRETKIIVKEATMIPPAEDLPNKHLWLSKLDLLRERNNTPTVYLHKKSTGSGFSFEAKAIKDAMSKILVHFYPVAGRLGRDDNDRLEIYCNSKGVMFIEAEIDCAIDDLGDIMRNVEFLQLIPTVDCSCRISSFPRCFSAIDYLELLDDLTPILRGPNNCRCPNLSIVSWMRLPLYEADFGMGKPVFVRSANPLPGKGYIMQTPTPVKDAKWAMIICLEQDQKQSFLKLFDGF